MASFRCHDNYDVIATWIITKFHLYPNTTVVSIFPNLCLWRRGLRTNVGGIHSKKLYRATLIILYLSTSRDIDYFYEKTV